MRIRIELSFEVIKCKVGQYLIHLNDTFEWSQTLIDKIAILHVAHEAASTSCPEKNFRNAKLLSSIKSEAHGAIRNYASDWRAIVVEVGKKVSKGRQAVFSGGDTEGGNVLGGINIGGRETIGNGLELEGGDALEGVWTPRFEQAVMVVLCVDKGNVEPSEMKELS